MVFGRVAVFPTSLELDQEPVPEMLALPRTPMVQGVVAAAAQLQVVQK